VRYVNVTNTKNVSWTNKWHRSANNRELMWVEQYWYKSLQWMADETICTHGTL